MAAQRSHVPVAPQRSRRGRSGGAIGLVALFLNLLLPFSAGLSIAADTGNDWISSICFADPASDDRSAPVPPHHGGTSDVCCAFCPPTVAGLPPDGVTTAAVVLASRRSAGRDTRDTIVADIRALSFQPRAPPGAPG